MKISRNNYLSYLAYGIMLLTLALFRQYVICGYLSAIVFILYIIYYAIQNKEIIAKYMFVFFGLALYVVGNMICDFIPTYLVELGVITKYVGSFPLLALLYWVYTIMLLVCDDYVSRRIIRPSASVNYKFSRYSVSKFLYKYLLVIIFLMGTMFFVWVAPHPSFALNINRFSYAQKYLPPVLNKLRTIPILLSPLALITVMRKDYLSVKQKVLSLVVAYAPYIVFSFWIGNKFGSYWQLFWSLAIPCVSYIDFNKLKTGKYLKIGFRIFLALVAVVAGYWIMRGNDLAAIITKFTVRFSAQGELWWRVVADKSFGSAHMDVFWEELGAIVESILTSGERKEYGVYRLMRMFGASSYLQSYYAMDMRLSAYGFELAFLCFGLWAYLIFPLFTVVIQTVLVNLYICTTKEKRISSVVYLRLLVVFETANAQGDWYRFFSILDIALVLLLLLDIAMVAKSKGYGAFRRNTRFN